jgi:putative PIN family toxin of toxin-antitoxin system
MRYARRAPLAPRAVLDSSVLVSAFITPRGSVVRLLHAPARDRYELCLSQFILTETAETLLSKPRLRQYAAYADRDVHDFIRWLLRIVGHDAQLGDIAHDFRLREDDPIIATAVAAGAGYLVTGDRAHLLPIGRYEGIRIVSPRAFLEILR